MASRREQNMKYRRYSGRVNGNLAYDPAYEERQRKLRREREYEREHERQREEFMRPPQRKVQKKAAPVRRQREKVSLGTLCGFMALAAMVALMIMCRAQLTEISAQVVSVQKEISALEDEHVALLTRYEKTFDLTTIKEAAAAAGMAKPSASQVYYIDLSEPDSVVVYQQKSQNVLSRVLTSLGNGVCAVVPSLPHDSSRDSPPGRYSRCTIRISFTIVGRRQGNSLEHCSPGGGSDPS